MPIRPEADLWIAFLNDLLASDPEFVQKLVTTRFKCNETIADHPTVQVCCPVDDNKLETGEFSAGFVGVLNGFLGTFGEGPYKDSGAVSFTFDDATGKIVKFSRVENCRTADPGKGQ